MDTAQQNHASLETLVESADLGFEILHPGGTEITRELAELCAVQDRSYLLDVACGTGESACYLTEQLGARVVGIDGSVYMIAKAKRKAEQRGLSVEFREADAHQLPFRDDTFDAVISECTVCLLDKEQAIREMVRVAKPGGHVGFHDICWQGDTPLRMRKRLAEIEGERPETLNGWKTLCERAGLVEVQSLDRSALLAPWMRETMKAVSISAIMKITWMALRRWGLRGLMDAWESERIFQSKSTGYGLLVGRKPALTLAAR